MMWILFLLCQRLYIGADLSCDVLCSDGLHLRIESRAAISIYLKRGNILVLDFIRFFDLYVNSLSCCACCIWTS